MLTLRALTLVLGVASVAACGSGGNGGVPTGSHASSDPPPTGTSTSAGTTTGSGKSGPIYPGRVTPGGGTSTGTGTSGSCADVCAKLATCGADTKTCLAGCASASSACIACAQGATCSGLDACSNVCEAQTGSGGSSSSGSAGHSSTGSAGSSSAPKATTCSTVADHLKNDCNEPDSAVSAFTQACSSLSAACLSCWSGACASLGNCASCQ